ncbi:hypothetical protein G3I28_07130, partial [Streptomyces sp. SID10116]|nr:hypothetical protein [Streptomyces sp. SID10116]
ERVTGGGERTAGGKAGATAPARPPAPGAVLGDLTRMENSLTALATRLPHGETDEITARLEALLARWKTANVTTDDTTGAAGNVTRNGTTSVTTNLTTDDDSAADRLKAASADQIFDFIDNELGVGPDTSRATPTPKAG